MKRLTLSAFKAEKQSKATAQLLGQVLGNCHDQHSGLGTDDDEEEDAVEGNS